MKSNKVVFGLLGIATGIVVLASGCDLGDKASQPFQDAGRTGTINKEKADIIEMPDGFNNLATKCDHGKRIYVSYHGDSAYGFGFAVDDAACAK
jgi:hypothetical protein